MPLRLTFLESADRRGYSLRRKLVCLPDPRIWNKKKFSLE